MAKKVAVLAVDPVNGAGLFQYLEAFFENGIPYRVFAVADSPEIKTNSGIALRADDVVAHLKEHEAEYDALVFACGDAMPKFGENASKGYNQDMMAVIGAFAGQGKLIAGHCAFALLLDPLGVIEGKKVATHPFVQGMIKSGTATDKAYEIDGNFFTAQTENTLSSLMPELIKALK